MNKDPIVLSYDESLLRKSDVDLLHGPHWLNDNIISFYFEYLKNTFKNAPFMLFVSPEVTQCIKIISGSQMKVFLDPLESKDKQFIFFAFNDNERPQTVGGTHWSLILFSRSDRMIYHYDSSRGSNCNQAQNFANKLFGYFGIEGQFSEESSLQQTNGYDCGIYLICNAEHLGRHLATHRTLKNYYSFNDDLCNSVGTMSFLKMSSEDVHLEAETVEPNNPEPKNEDDKVVEVSEVSEVIVEEKGDFNEQNQNETPTVPTVEPNSPEPKNEDDKVVEVSGVSEVIVEEKGDFNEQNQNETPTVKDDVSLSLHLSENDSREEANKSKTSQDHGDEENENETLSDKSENIEERTEKEKKGQEADLRGEQKSRTYSSLSSENPLKIDEKEGVKEGILGFASSYLTTDTVTSDRPPYFQPEDLTDFDIKSEAEFDRDAYYSRYDEIQRQFQEEKRRNQFLHKKVGDYYKKRKMHHVLQEGPITIDLQKKYQSHLNELSKLHEEHTNEQVRMRREIEELKRESRTKGEEAKHLFESFQKAELELAKELENLESTGRITVIERFLKRQRIQLANIIKMRVNYIKLKNHFNEKQGILDSLDNLGPGIRLSDYEQLKFDNRNLIDKYEEKEVELRKVRQKCQNAAQVLAHVREKVVALEGDIEALEERMDGTKDEYEEVRAQLSDLKYERDMLRESINQMKATSGLLTRPKLLVDLQKATAELKQTIQAMKDCKSEYEKDVNIVTKMRMVMNSPKKIEKLKAKMDREMAELLLRESDGDSDFDGFQFKFDTM